MLRDDANDLLRCAAVGSPVFNVDEYLIDEIIGGSSSVRPETLPKRRHAARYLLAYCKNLSLPYILTLKDWLRRTHFEPEPRLDEMNWYAKHSLTQYVYDAETRRIAFLCSSGDRLKLRYEYSQAEAFVFAQRLAMDQLSKEDLTKIKKIFKILGFPGDPWETYKCVVRAFKNPPLYLDVWTPREIEYSLHDSSSETIPLFAKDVHLENNKILTTALHEEIEKIFDERLEGVLEKMRASIADSRDEIHTLIQSKNDVTSAAARKSEESMDRDSRLIIQHLSRSSRKQSLLIVFGLMAFVVLLLSKI